MPLKGRVASEVLTSAAGDALSEEVRNFLKKFGETDAGKKILEALGKKAVKIFDSDDCRIDMLNFVNDELIKRADGMATKNILLYLQNALDNSLGDNAVIKNLSVLFEKTRTKKSDGTYTYPDPKDDKYLLSVFERIGLCSEEEFLIQLEHYNNNPAEQLLRYTGRQVKKGWDTAGNIARVFIASAVAWFLTLFLISQYSQVLTWTIALLPGIILFVIGMTKVNPLTFPIANWVSERFKLGIMAFAYRTIALGIGTALLLSYFPIPSDKMALLLAVGVFGIIFARLGKGPALVSFASWLVVLFVLYSAVIGNPKTDALTIKATASTAIAEAKQLIGKGPGSSQDNPIMLGANPSADPFQIGIGSTVWFKIEPREWSQWVSCPEKAHFNIVYLSSRVRVKCYIVPPGQPSHEEIYVAGPGERPSFPLYVTKLSFNTEKSVRAGIGVVKNKSQ